METERKKRMTFFTVHEEKRTEIGACLREPRKERRRNNESRNVSARSHEGRHVDRELLRLWWVHSGEDIGQNLCGD